MTLLTASFALLVAVASAPTSKLALVTVAVDDIAQSASKTGSDSPTIVGLPSLFYSPATKKDAIDASRYTVRIGVWSMCAGLTGDQTGESVACTGKLQRGYEDLLYNKTILHLDGSVSKSPGQQCCLYYEDAAFIVGDNAAFKDSMSTLIAAKEALEGLGPMMVSVPIAAGLT